MTITRKQSVLCSFAVGMILPCAIEFGGRYLDSVGVHKPPWWSTLFIYIWPTGVWLIGTSEDLRGYIGFTISVIANALLYALVAIVVGYLVKLIRDPYRDGWWPDNPR